MCCFIIKVRGFAPYLVLKQPIWEPNLRITAIKVAFEWELSCVPLFFLVQQGFALLVVAWSGLCFFYEEWSGAVLWGALLVLSFLGTSGDPSGHHSA